LSFYQLWADDLFKKAKFRDTLRIIEKLGHTKTIRWQREAWINEARNTKLRTGGSAAASSLSGVAEPVEHDGQLHPEVNDDDLYSLPTGRIPPSAKDKGKEKDIEPINPNALFLGTLSDESDEEMMDFDDAELEALMNERERSARGNATESNCDGGSGGENNNIIETPDESASADRLPACIRFSTPPPRTMPEDEVVDDEDAWEAMGM
jgi:replication fork protection complex subunit Csm3/Swi3